MYFRPDDLEIVCSDYGSRIVKKKKLYFAIFALHMVLLLLVAIRIPANFQRVSIRGNTFINESLNTKALKNTRYVLKLTYDSAVMRQWWTYLLSVKHHYITNRSCKESKFSTRVVSIVKMMGKPGTSYKETGGSEAVSTLCDKKS